MTDKLKRFLIQNVLSLQFNELVKTAIDIEPTANQNIIMQMVSDLVFSCDIIPVFYNPKSGKYEPLPKEYRTTLEMVPKKEFRVLYRKYKKKAVHRIMYDIADAHTKQVTEPATLIPPKKTRWSKRLKVFFVIGLVLLICSVITLITLIGS